MKFLHAADIHLDSPLTGLAGDRHIPAAVTAGVTRRAFTNLVDLAIAEAVDFVVIAGDLYDGDWRDYSTGLFFAREMRRLARPCFLVRGNHDARSQIARHLEAPPNVREFSSHRAQTERLEALRVALHGRSFPNRAVPEDLSTEYPPPVPGWLNIGVLHTSAEDPVGDHDRYAPCSIEALRNKGYDYWALGHIHQRRDLNPSGRPWIVFPGNLQGRHARETGAKGCTLVEESDGEIVRVEHRNLDVLRWESVLVDATGADSIAELSARMRVALEAAVVEGRPVIARVTLDGATPCHGALVADPERIEAECRNAAEAVAGELHIERVRLATRAPAEVGEDALSALRRSFMGALDDGTLRGRLLAEFREMDSQVPGGAGPGRTRPPLDEEGLRALAEDAWAVVASLLADGAAP